MIEDSSPRIVPPMHCHSCGCSKFHKDEKRTYTYQDYVDSSTVSVQVHRRRYRCSRCGTKQWDHVCGASTYLRKTYRLIHWEEQMHNSKRKRKAKQVFSAE